MNDAPHQETHLSPDPSGWGSIIGIVIIVFLLVLGGVYFFMSSRPLSQQAPAVGAGRA